MKQNGIIAIVCCGLAFAMACKKKDNTSPTAQKLQAGVWQISGSDVVKYNGRDTTIDLYSRWRACEQDDLIVFDKDGTATSNENANKCEEDDQIVQMKWELLDNDTKLKLTLVSGVKFSSTGSNTTLSQIAELSDTQMQLRFDDVVNGTTMTIVETYKNTR